MIKKIKFMAELFKKNKASSKKKDDLGSNNRDTSDRHYARDPSIIVPRTPDRRGEAIVEAQGWLRKPDGTVVLTAEASTVTPYIPWWNSISCYAY